VAELPSGTVTFLFTDLEGSTRLWEEHPEAMGQALARHDEILREAIESHGGSVVKTTGDGIHAVFATAHDALDAAVVLQVSLRAEPFGETGPLRVRMGVHTCEAEYRDGDYYGSEVNRAARLMGVAHGGQIVVSLATSTLVRDASVELVDLGDHRLRDLTNPERMFQVSASGLAQNFPPLRSLDAFPGNLPVQVSSFIGREVEIVRVEKALHESRIVTLTGVGGVGKTRLALRVAAEAIGRYPDGAWLCELAPVSDPGAVWDTLASTLRVAPLPGRSTAESVLEFLTVKRLLLVLDNCEHLLDGAARVVDSVVHRCPEVSVMATSREGLALDGERLLAVPALGLPADDAGEDDLPHAEAMQLFSDRACAARDDFVLAGPNASTVAVLCRRLDGIPLAIELAAARVRAMSPEDLVARLDQRFKLLTRGSRAAMERHQTLRSTIDWSYGLLEVSERRVLDRLSVFAGGCDLSAAEDVIVDDELDTFEVDDLLTQLVDKSLVVADGDPSTGVVRYRLLESIRQYAQEQLEGSGETAELRRRHADHYVAWAERAHGPLRGRSPEELIAAALREVDNFRAALDWSVEVVSPDHALRLIAPMTLHGTVGEAALEWSVTACTIPGASDHALYSVVAGWASWSATRVLDFERAEAFALAGRDAEERLGVRHPTMARAWATLEFYRGDFTKAQEHAREWTALASASRDRYELPHSLAMLGGALYAAGRIDEAVVELDEAVRVARAWGIDDALAFPLVILVDYLAVEDPERALTLIDEAIEVTTRIGEPMGLANAIRSKGAIAMRRGDWAVALRVLSDALDVSRQIGDIANGFSTLYCAAVTLSHLEMFESSAVLTGKADSVGVRAGPEWLLELVAANDDILREQLGEPTVDELAARGAALGYPEVAQYLRSETERVSVGSDS
jgi:predicted ATPase/class 3 adenylate cyclase